MDAMKKLLLASSIATLVFLAASALSENVFVSWKAHQRTYAKLLAERTPGANAKREILSAPVELQQIVVPDLHLADRCVTCHRGLDNPAMAGTPNPYAPHPGDILKIHPPEKFGCTVCHRGQGAAVNFREAKATDVFWDYPLLPPELLESSCGICHDPKAVRGAPVLAQGARLFEEKGCHSCHRLGGLGGSLGAGLDSVGRKTRHQLVMTHVQGERTTYRWLDLHFKDPQGIVKDSLMKPDYPTDDEARALTVYMLSLQADRKLPDRAVAKDRHRMLADGHDRGERDGRTLYERLCRTCHGGGTYCVYDRFLRRFVPAIRNPAFLAMTDRKY